MSHRVDPVLAASPPAAAEGETTPALHVSIVSTPSSVDSGGERRAPPAISTWGLFKMFLGFGWRAYGGPVAQVRRPASHTDVHFPYVPPMCIPMRARERERVAAICISRIARHAT